MKQAFHTALAVLAGMGSAATASASPVPLDNWTQEAKLVLARAWVGEADWNAADHIAIGWVLAKRWKMYNRTREEPKRVRFTRFVGMYCSPLKGHSVRQRRIQALPWGDPVLRRVGPYRHQRNVKRWQIVRERVEQWGKGAFSDPCPNALHWGGTMDKPYRNWKPVQCGPTRNTFYRIQRIRTSRS